MKVAAKELVPVFLNSSSLSGLEIRPRSAQGHVTRKPGWCIERFLHFRGSGAKAPTAQCTEI